MLDEPVELVGTTIADQLLAIDEERCRHDQYVLDVRICRAPLFTKLGVILHLNDQSVWVLGRRRRLGERQLRAGQACRDRDENDKSMHHLSPLVVSKRA